MGAEDGQWDPAQGGAPGTGSTTTSAQKSLWDLNGLNPDTPIIVSYGSKTPKNLDPYDTQIADASRAAQPGKAGDLVKRPITLYGSDPKAYLALQQALFAGGFYGSTPVGSIPWGTDPQGATYDAWKKVLVAAQQAQDSGINVTPDQILQQGIKEHTAAKAAEPVPKNPLAIQLTDPSQIASSAQSAAQAVLGRNLSDEEVMHFISEYHAAETTYSKQAYETNNDQTGGTHVLTQPSLSGTIDTELHQKHGTEIAGNNLSDYVRALEQMVGGGG